MIPLIRFEWYKLCKSLLVWFVLIALGIFLLTSLVEPIDRTIKSQYEKFEGTATTQIFNSIKADSEKINNNKAILGNDTILKNRIYDHILDLQEAQIYKQQTLKSLNMKSSKGWDYALQKSLVTRIDVSRISYQDPAEIIAKFSNKTSILIPFLAIILLLTVSYTREHMTGVEQYQLVSIYGRKSLLFAKWFAAIGFITLIHVLTYGATIATIRYQLGPIDWSAPMQVINGLTASPYPLSIGGYVLVTFFYQGLAWITLCTFVLFLSLLAKNYVQTFLYTVLFIGIPYLYGYIIPDVFFPEAIRRLVVFFPSRGVLTDEIFGDYSVLLIGGLPLLLPIVIVFFWIFLNVILLIYMTFYVKRREIA
ncbi:ABC transporter permease subunit [Exiguobacterium sp. R-39]|uniref:ABC transporter permease subunit n=1 Tax=Exiguobacterium sp. R-39 TaxID=3416708 RepID=UPI003CECCF49